MIRESGQHLDERYWTWRSAETGELACLVYANSSVPFGICSDHVHMFLRKPIHRGPVPSHMISVYIDTDHTFAQWETWHAFEICPTIHVYATRLNDDGYAIEWDRKEIKL